jgi:hypothetical protein
VSVKGATTLAGRIVKTFGSLFTRQVDSHIFFPHPRFSPRPGWPVSACLGRELKPSRSSPVRFVTGRLVLKASSTPMASWLGYAKFPALENGQHNTWQCERSGNPMRFHAETSVFCTP